MIPGPQGEPGTPGDAGASGAMGTIGTFSPANTVFSGGTASATQVMMGIGNAGAAFTPITSGNVAVFITGMMGNGTVADGASVQLRYGVGAAPGYNASAAGTGAGAVKNMVASTAVGKQGFAISTVITGLTIGVPVWLDLGLAQVTGGTATVYDVDVVWMEA